MSWHYLQGPEAASWEGSCLDGAPFALLRLIPTRAGCCSPDNATACSSPSPSGMMCEPSTGLHGAGTSTLSAAAFRVRTSAPRATAPASTVSAPGSGLSLLASLATFDPRTCSWRTRQCSLIEGLDAFSAIWPRWGTMRAGECWELAPLVRHTHGKECGLWPTPLKQDSKHGAPTAWELEHARQKGLHIALGWKVHPCSSEWLMAWPIGWTDLGPLETDKFRQWCDSHGRH